MPFSGDIRSEYLKGLIAQSTTDKFAWEALKRIAAIHLRKRDPLPWVLCEWLADMLEGDRRQPRTGSNKAVEHMRIYLSVREVVETEGLLATRSIGPEHCCAEGGSACDVVGAAFGTGYKNVEKIWGKWRPRRHPPK